MEPSLCRHDWLPVQEIVIPTGWIMSYVCRYCEARHQVAHDHDAAGRTSSQVVEQMLTDGEAA